jgi:hypothetical protein
MRLNGHIRCGFFVCLTAAILAPAQSPSVFSPTPDGVANDARPVVRWTPVAGAASYRMMVFADARLDDLLDTQVVVANEARVGVDLVDDSVFYVKVFAYDGGPRLVSSGPVSRFKTLLRPQWMPAWSMVTQDPVQSQGGYRLLNLLDVRPPQGARRIPALVLVNAAGEMVWYVTYPFSGFIQSPRVLANGHLMFLTNQLGAHPTTGFGVEMSWRGRLNWVSREGVVPHHEIGIGPSGHCAYLKWVWGVHNGEIYEGDGIELVDRNGEGGVVWEWNIFDHFPAALWPTPQTANQGLSAVGGDWSHANALVWDPSRRLFWMSVRHFDNIVGIDYPSGDVRVILGKGGLGGVGLMSHQHSPEIQADGTMLLYDNGNGYQPPFTRVTQIAFDPAAGTANIVWEWRDSPDFFDFAVGDSDRLPNGNVLVTAGVSGRVIEVTPAGNKVWELKMTGAPRWWYYRAIHVPDKLIDPGILPFGGSGD